MRRLALLISVFIAIAFIALGLTAAWSLLYYRPQPLDGDSTIHAMKAMRDVAELRATADSLAFRKDLVSADFNQVFPAACIALMIASAVGAPGFAWIAYALFRKKQVLHVDRAL